MKKMNLAVVGSGSIAGKVLKEISGISQIASIYSTNVETADTLAKKYGAKQCFAFEEILTDQNVDCIYVTTPHTSHCHYASLALKAGKHVICEKPAAMNRLQLGQMLDFSASGNAYFGEIMHFRYAPVFRRLREILDAKPYGKLQKIYADIGFDAYSLPKRKRLLYKEAGGGALLDVGIYIAALVDFVFGDTVVCNSKLRVEKTEDGVDVEDQLHAQINGVSCTFLCSLKRVLPSAAVFVFENGQVEIPLFFKPNKLILKDKTGAEILEEGRFRFTVQFQKAFEDMQAGCRESQPYGHLSSYRTVCLLDEVRKQGQITYAPELEAIDILEQKHE